MASIRGFLTATALAALATAFAGAPAQAFTFQNIIDPADPTFNQALGINNSGLISGYFGSGADPAHPNKGYTVPSTALTSFTPLNFPNSAQTQVTGLNNNGTFVGFYVDAAGANIGFWNQGGQLGTFNSVANPNTTSVPPFNQLLGVNDSNVAVGFFNDVNGNSHGYTYNIGANSFSSPINDPLGTSTIAAGINNAGDIVGFYTDAGGVTHGFLDVGGSFTTLDPAGSTFTQLLGINNKGLIVGTETDTGGATHGVIYNDQTHLWTVVDDPNGIGTTVLNGLNDKGQAVGFYTDGAGNTIGLLASPAPEPGKGVLGLALLILAFATGRRLARTDAAL